MLSLVGALAPFFCRARAEPAGSSLFSGKLAEPITTVPEAAAPPSGLLAPPEAEGVAAALGVLAGGDDELGELPLEHAVTAARPMAVSAATPLAAAILRVIWVSFRKGWFIRSWPACAGRPG